MTVGVLLGGLAVVDLDDGTKPTPVDVIDAVDRSPYEIQSGNGPTTIETVDGNRIGSLVAAMPTPSSEPVADRVLEELLDDELVARSLARTGVTGDRDVRAVLLADAGLTIETSIRSEALDAARASVNVDGLASALVAVSTGGEIVALAGPTSVVKRQPAGAYLPVVMATAIESGVRSDEELPAPANISPAEDYVVGNVDGEDLGTLTLAEALAASANTPWAGLVADGRISTDDVAAMADRLGLSAAQPGGSQRPAPPSIVFGISEVTPTALAGAYATFATGGARPDLHVIRRLLDDEGRVLYDAASRPAEPTHVLDRDVAIEVRQAMEQVICCGTGAEARLEGDVAQFGKTGTTSRATDAWFAGSTPGLTTVVWAGSIEGVEENTGLTGGGAPARIWKAFMERAVQGTDPRTFTE